MIFKNQTLFKLKSISQSESTKGIGIKINMNRSIDIILIRMIEFKLVLLFKYFMILFYAS